MPALSAGESATLAATEEAEAWLLDMQRCVRALDYSGCRELFADEVCAFGTHSTAMRGLDLLEYEQWRHVWPRIRDFTYRLDTLCVWEGGDRLCLAVEWDSQGARPDGSLYSRPGRATFALARRDQGLVAMHSHLSLA